MHAIDENYDFDDVADQNDEIVINNNFRDPFMQQFLQITDVIDNYNDAIEEFENVMEEPVVAVPVNSIATNKLKSSDKYLNFQKLILDFISVSNTPPWRTGWVKNNSAIEGTSNNEQYDWKDAVDLTAQFTTNNIPTRVASDILLTIQKILARHQLHVPLPNDSKTTKDYIAKLCVKIYTESNVFFYLPEWAFVEIQTTIYSLDLGGPCLTCFRLLLKHF